MRNTRYIKKAVSPSYPLPVKLAFAEASKVHALQIKQEFLEFLTLLHNYQVSSVLEIGAYQGGTARAFLSMGMRVVSIDKEPQPELLTLTDPRFTLVQADSHNPNTRDSVADCFGAQKFDLVCIDGGHTEIACETDYIYYSPLAKKLVAFHDITPTERHPDVAKVWARVKAKFSKHYEIQHPGEIKGHGWGIIEI